MTQSMYDSLLHPENGLNYHTQQQAINEVPGCLDDIWRASEYLDVNCA